ncbi:hypothetical protein NMY22_g6140 [Coprinellus aureogranulatus]|nr:hypothetical protein NMY22_g6140 [Coprinellus aureogranulatus]
METVQQKKQLYSKQLAEHTFRQYQLAWHEKELKNRSSGKGRESGIPSSNQAAKDRVSKRTSPKELSNSERNQNGVRNRVVQARDFAADIMKGHSGKSDEPSERR